MMTTPEHSAGRVPARIRSPWFTLVPGVAVLDLLLLLPNHPGAMTLEALTFLPLELPPLLLSLLFAPPACHRILSLSLGILLGFTTALKAADFLAFLSYNRLFSPVLDIHLARAAWNLGWDSFGLTLVVAAAVAAAIAVFTVGWIAAWAARQVMLAGADDAARRQAAVLAAVMLIVFSTAYALKRLEIAQIRTAAFTSMVVREHVTHVVRSIGDIRRFEAGIGNDRFASMPADRLLSAIKGRDVLMVFVESYGRTTLDNRRYQATTRAALKDLRGTLEKRGLAARSGWLTSPVIGGQSWLAHASVLSGLWISNQPRYDALLTSGRDTLIDTFSRAGWSTVAVMPAITRPWPEGRALGYDRIYTSGTLGYDGLPFNWVTMPDQFTLAQFHRRELTRGRRPPVFAEIAMISSHAPWTPIAPVMDWSDVFKPKVFDRWAASGDPPAKVWLDKDRVRDQYRQSIDYVLRTLNAFVEDKLGFDSLLVIIGDHQPAPLITGPDAGRDVPVHMIGPPAVISALDGWGWSAGLVPSRTLDAWSMKDFRERFLEAFTPPRTRRPAERSNIGPPLSGGSTSSRAAPH